MLMADQLQETRKKYKVRKYEDMVNLFSNWCVIGKTLFINRDPMGPYEVGDILEAGSVIKGNGL
jgi:hypothetical protein